MRLIVVLLVLLVSATAVDAQEPGEPATPVNWLCDNAFVQAELVAGLATQPAAADMDATGGTDGEDDGLEPTATDELAADPAATTASTADRDPSFLDDAIRACASVEDFVAGAALHPALLGDIEPIAWLGERCQQADLADYSTCVTLVHALATPAPTARPTATPTPRPTIRPEPRATSRPDGGSARTRPDDGKVRVPALRAKVPGATRVVYFDIRGRTWNQLDRSTSAHTARLCRNHQARACLETRISNVRPRYRADSQTGACTLTGLSANLTTVAYMPRWSAPRRVSPELAWVWRKSIARTGWHEAQHAKIAKRHFRQLPKLVAGKPCSRFAAVTTRWWNQLTRAQDKFDRKDYRTSAVVHLRWFQRAYEHFR